MIRTYTVSWTVEVDAEAYEEAAEQAWGMIQDPASVATVLFVQTYGEDGVNFDMESDAPTRLAH